MREPFTQLYVHLVWSTWDRQPFITSEIQPRIFAALADKCRGLKCEPLAIGGISDHVHLLCRFHPSISIFDLVKELKGSTSHLVTHEIARSASFKWQGAYGAFTIRKSEIPQVKDYSLNQEQHHFQNDLDRIFEQDQENTPQIH